MNRVLLGITGSIAAYKGAEIAGLLTKGGYSVQVILTAAARHFITPLTLQTLSKNKVYTDMFEELPCPDVRHISLAKNADLVLIAPASANIIGKIAAGIADDMLSTVIMAVRDKPVLICPAMNTAMYENPIVRDNMAKLAGYGYRFVEPRESRLACGDLGKGALADTRLIVDRAAELLGKP
jgi:phosphopantothenoylcysteine decarboxylase/phosphopantothenoylcysteine decarboxylase/phosphopantothenate--cysteine ligase